MSRALDATARKLGPSQLQLAAVARAHAQIETAPIALSAMVQMNWESYSNVADYVRATILETQPSSKPGQCAESAG